MAHSHQVTVVEQNPDALRRLGTRHNCKIVLGSGIDEDVLVKAGIAETDAFFSVTRGDNTNIMAAQIAQINYGVKHICIRVADPNRAEAYRRMGFFCLTPSLIVAGIMRDWVEGTELKPADQYNVLPAELEVN
jgi:trk system potassium uptake protein